MDDNPSRTRRKGRLCRGRTLRPARAAARAGAVAAFLFWSVLAGAALADTGNPAAPRYPTADEVYYVLACMDMNGQNATGLHKCSCAINALEARLPYQDYSDAELVLAMRQAGGRTAAIFRGTAPMKAIVDKFLSAQGEANRQCFGTPPGAGAHAGGQTR